MEYPAQILLKRYCPVRDIPEYYDISEEKLNELLALQHKGIHVAELKDPRGTRRILHLDMVDVLNFLEKEPILKHLESKEVGPYE